MRIMFFAGGGDIGGGKTHILSLAKELSLDNQVRLISFREGIFAQDALAMGIDTAVVDHRKGFFYAIKMAKAQADEFKPDIVHCHGSKANALGIIIKKSRHIPVITTVHSDPKLDYMGKPLRHYTYGVINSWALKHMDYYVAVAGRMHDLLIERGFDPLKVYTVFNGLDFSGADENPRAFKNEEDTINIGIAARLNPVKDMETLIRAFALAYKKDDRLRLKIAGTGEEEQKLKSLAEELMVSRVVSFDGWISDMRAYFKDIDINVLSSLSETFPYSLLEGAYEHCPAIASNAGGIPYLIEHEKTGLLFECGDYETFAKHILRLASNQEERKVLAENLFKRAKDDFSLKRMKNDQQAIYESVLHKMQMNGKPYGIMLCGAYGRGNAGDEAILKALSLTFRKYDKDIPIWVMSKNPLETKLKEAVGSFEILNVFKFISQLKKTQLFISGGGSLIQDITSSRSLYFYLFTLFAAKKSGCRTMMYGCGIGPLISDRHKRLAARIMNRYVDIISLRDSGSLQFLKDIKVTEPKIMLTADPTFSLDSACSDDVDRAFKSENIPTDIKMMGFCIREWKYFSNETAIARAAEYAYRKYGLTPVFITIEHPKDVEIGRRVSASIAPDVPRYFCTKVHSDSILIGMLGRMQLICGMRLHSLIFASSACTPVIGISYDVKVDGFMKEIESNALIKAEALQEGMIEKLIDELVFTDRTKVVEISERLKSRERMNTEAAIGLLSK